MYLMLMEYCCEKYFFANPMQLVLGIFLRFCVIVNYEFTLGIYPRIINAKIALDELFVFQMQNKSLLVTGEFFDANIVLSFILCKINICK